MNHVKNDSVKVRLATVAIGFAVVTFIGCNNSDFSGSNSKKGGGSGNSSPQNPGGPNNGFGTNTNININTPGGNGVTTTPTLVACELGLDYKPNDIQCNIAAKNPQNIWMRTDGWKTAINAFSDSTAAWISPLAATNTDDGRLKCPNVPKADRLIYVSHFQTAPGSHSLEVIVDNTGSIRLWRDAKPTQEDLNIKLADMTLGKKTIDLPGYFYSVVIDSVDQGEAAAAIFSVRNAQGRIIRHTENNSEWCIFRVPANTDVTDYVVKAGSCRRCLIGANGQ